MASRFLGFGILIIDIKIPWRGDWAITMPLPTQETTNTEKTEAYIHARRGIRNHDRNVKRVIYTP
jgi:hypothetical protein